MDPLTSAKTYWSILESLLNKKTPRISPLFQQNKYVTDFKKKAELFNCSFVKQYSIINIPVNFPPIFARKQARLFQQSLSLVMI